MKVDWYFNGIYQGKKEISDRSVIGSLLIGNLDAAQSGMQKMVQELEEIPGTRVKCQLKVEKE